MRFMMIVKQAQENGFPPKELIDAINKLSEEAVRAGTMLSNGGLTHSAQGARAALWRKGHSQRWALHRV